ncbi:MFS general substrate transporter [Mollisia scopiformis]|uniref:MFS general substrate transporter n=1 Tax=Mollisia scopiformis TaxID=149040 RepID=A0A194XMC1_MOLSC|nr:MFS general substrate transporter [Mollisia scopiformis]KUJ21271.1 MFS general substrate transporter [Mollisia scopiformis]
MVTQYQQQQNLPPTATVAFLSSQKKDEKLDESCQTLNSLVSAPLPAEETSFSEEAVSDQRPEGGPLAWLHVVGGFLLFFNSWGILNTLGVFQTYYESGALFTTSSSTISWIGAVQAFLLLLVGLLVAPIYDRGYLRLLLAVGLFGVIFGHMMLSICTEYWQVMLSQGFCIGIGAGCLFVPCISILPTYFSSKLGLTVGLASSGSSVGGVIYPIVLNELLNRIGFAWSVRVLGFIALVTLLVPLSVMRMRAPPQRLRAFIDWYVFVSLPAVYFVQLTRDKNMLGTRIGMGCSMMAFGLLAGAPGAGAILGTTEPLRWSGVWLYCGLACFSSGLMYFVLRFYIWVQTYSRGLEHSSNREQ